LDSQQPLLISRPSIRARRRGDTKPIKLIPEFCLVTGLSEQMRSDNMMMRDLARETGSKPDERLASINKLIRNVNSNEETARLLDQWQTRFVEKPVEVQARRLEPEIIRFGGDVNKRLNEKADWSNDLKSVRHISAVPFKNWVVLHPQRDKKAADTFLEALFKVIYKMGIEVKNPKVVELANDRNDSYINGLKQHINRETQLVVCILPRPRKDLYDAIKRYCCIDFPVLSQCILVKNLIDAKKLMGVMTKVAVQMNCKLGGEIWAVSIPLPNVMICGIDA
jgi:aubergine